MKKILNLLRSALIPGAALLMGIVLASIFFKNYSGQYFYRTFTQIILIHITGFAIFTLFSGRHKKYLDKTDIRIWNMFSNRSRTDPGSHFHLDTYLEKLLSENTEGKKKFSLFYIRINNLKKIKKTLGHEQGNIVLKEIIGRLERQLREIDLVIRVSDDELIAVILNSGGEQSMSFVAKRILMTANTSVFSDNFKVDFSISIGISNFPEDGNNKYDLIKKADIAMYHALGNGPNSYSYFKEEFNKVIQHNFLVEQQLLGAIEKNELSVVFQPKVNSGDGRIESIEALVRWNNCELGYVSPSHFIPVAEKTGLIHSISEWIYIEAFEQLVHIHKQGFHKLTLSVNVSPAQISENTLEKSLQRAISLSGLDPSFVELEITEGMLLHSNENTETTLINLKNRGYGIAIDDFGTGYSSLSYLVDFNIDTLKIDRSFISKILPDNDTSEIVKAIINMAGSLDIQTIAEGVECLSQLEILKKLNCDLIQGYYFHKPMKNIELLYKLKRQEISILTKPDFETSSSVEL